MLLYKTIKMFDLASAPRDVLDSRDFVNFESHPVQRDEFVLSLTVGELSTGGEVLGKDCIVRKGTMAEYELHRWLTEQGAEKGENILLRWNADAS